VPIPQKHPFQKVAAATFSRTLADNGSSVHLHLLACYSGASKWVRASLRFYRLVITTTGIATLLAADQPLNHTRRDRAALRAHFVFLQQLLRAGKAFLAHQCRHRDFDPLFAWTLVACCVVGIVTPRGRSGRITRVRVALESRRESCRSRRVRDTPFVVLLFALHAEFALDGRIMDLTGLRAAGVGRMLRKKA
jgi:hypothetical protein